MHNFPIINNISEILPHLEGRPEFFVAEREGYRVINYQMMMRDTFPNLEDESGSILRECRGIIFCSETGNIIRRPLHKFFNINEREETFADNIDLSKSHVILEKLDGSMIVPFYAQERLIWGTKMGDTDVAQPVMKFVEQHPIYNVFADDAIRFAWSPIFEWCSRKQRIVMDYGPDDQLVLIAMRDINTGEYMNYGDLLDWCSLYRPNEIPVVKTFDAQTNGISEFIDHVKDLENLEGFVIRFDDGQMFKMKCDWYIQLHKAKEAVLQDRNIVGLIIDNMLDDIKSAFPPDERVKLEKFEFGIQELIEDNVDGLMGLMRHIHNVRLTKKDFALGMAPHLFSLTKTAIFSLWDEPTKEKAFEITINTIRKHLNSTEKYNILKLQWFNGYSYND